MSLLATAASCPASESSRTGSARVEQLLEQMTLVEKISMIHGALEPEATDQGQAGYLPGLSRLGIPPLRMADGPPGVLTMHPATAPTATMGLAATFSRETARLNGELIGRDARALGQQVVLEPFINIYRDSTFGRGYNTFGEDPLLTGQIGAELIRGIQSHGIMAQAKHFVAYDGADDVTVDEQTLREIYLAPFADAVDAGVSSIMASYNRVNGRYAAGNGPLQQDYLKNELGFEGFVTSDWGAVHSTDYINHGLDLEMPGAYALTGSNAVESFFMAELPRGRQASFSFGRRMPEEAGPLRLGTDESEPLGMLDAVRSGLVEEATITAAVRRILVQMERFGYLDGKAKYNATPITLAENLAVAQKTAEQAAVLLKNEGDVLPLGGEATRRLALIGPGALQTVAVGRTGEKALGVDSARISPCAAMEQALTRKRVTCAVANDMTGTAIPAEALSHGAARGLRRTDARSGADVQVDAQLDFTLSNGRALPPGSSWTWYGHLDVPEDGDYLIYLQTLGATAKLVIDGQTIGTTSTLFQHGNILQPNQDSMLPTTDGLNNVRRSVSLTTGKHVVQVSIEGETAGAPVQVRLSWVTPQEREAHFQEAVEAARNAHTAVVFAWRRGTPRFGLPEHENRLVEAVAAVNANTIVVLNTSDPVALPWLPRVKAVLQMWYPGDAGGPATANLLLGRTSPAGRLPFTWPTSLEQGPANDPAHPERSSSGVNGKTVYSEGIFIGYRWFDRQQLEPLYPFGYGLSYTRFTYSDLKVTPAEDGGLQIRFRVRNTGRRDSDDVPQVYLGPPGAVPQGVQIAERSLVAFDRISVKGGASRDVTLHVPLRRLQYWDAANRAWVAPEGARTVFVGASSRDLRLESAVQTPRSPSESP